MKKAYKKNLTSSKSVYGKLKRQLRELRRMDHYRETSGWNPVTQQYVWIFVNLSDPLDRHFLRWTWDQVKQCIRENEKTFGWIEELNNQIEKTKGDIIRKTFK